MELPAGTKPWLHDLARWIGTWLYRPAYRIRLHGKENVPADGPLLVVANHSTMIEPQLVFGAIGRRSSFLVKQEMFKGVAGKALIAIGQVPVRRGEPDRTPLLTAIRVLRSGGVVGIFPEGTRGAGDVRNAEQGAAWLVRSTGATVLPVAVRGTLRPTNVSRRRWRPRVDIYIGQSTPVEVERGRAGLVAGTERIRVLLADLVAELDQIRAGRS